MSVVFDLTGRAVVVTGAARGLGRAIATGFAAAGADVTAVDTDGEALDEAFDTTVRVTPVVTDITDGTAVDSTVSTIVARAGRIDVLVNNAGILRDRVLWKLSDEDWAQVLAVHLNGTFNCTRATIPTMRSAGFGRIINVTSYTGLHGNVGQANYAAAKAGIIGLTRTAAKELAPFGITVNAISPNARTRMVESIPDEQLRQLTAQIPLGRFAEPSEIAPAVLFLASEQAGYITGTVLPVDGGLSI